MPVLARVWWFLGFGYFYIFYYFIIIILLFFISFINYFYYFLLLIRALWFLGSEKVVKVVIFDHFWGPFWGSFLGLFLMLFINYNFNIFLLLFYIYFIFYLYFLLKKSTVYFLKHVEKYQISGGGVRVTFFNILKNEKKPCR